MFDKRQLDQALAVAPWEERLSKQAQAKLTELRQALMAADTRWREARLLTAPADSYHLIHAWDDVPVGLGHETVTFRTSLDADREDHFEVRVEPEYRRLRVRLNAGQICVLSHTNNGIYVVGQQ